MKSNDSICPRCGTNFEPNDKSRTHCIDCSLELADARRVKEGPTIRKTKESQFIFGADMDAEVELPEPDDYNDRLSEGFSMMGQDE